MDITASEAYLSQIRTAYWLKGGLAEQSLNANHQMTQFSLLSKYNAAKLLNYSSEKFIGISLAQLKHTIGQLVSQINIYRVNVLDTIARLEQQHTLYPLLNYLTSKNMSITNSLDSVFKDYTILDYIEFETFARNNMALPTAQANYDLRANILDILMLRFQSLYLDSNQDSDVGRDYQSKSDLIEFNHQRSEYLQIIQHIGQLIFKVSVNSINPTNNASLEIKYIQNQLSVYNINDLTYVINNYSSFLSLLNISIFKLNNDAQFSAMIGYDLLKNIIISYNGIVNLIKFYISNEIEV